MQPDRTGDRTAVDIVREDLRLRYAKRGNVYLEAVHRLDRPVSGALVLARTSKAASRLAAQFRSGEVEKIYVALVERPPQPAHGTLEHWLRKDPATNHVRVVDPGAPGARRAQLEYESLGERRGGTLIEVRLGTGRTHQIRVQLAAIGCIVVGDVRYGAARGLETWIALHGRDVAFDHPTQGTRISAHAPLPDSWSDLLLPC